MKMSEDNLQNLKEITTLGGPIVTLQESKKERERKGS